MTPSKNLFTAIPFPFRIQEVNPSRLLYESSDTIFDAPSYRASNESFFLGINIDGWSVCRNGYSVYTQRIVPSGNLVIIIHGLKVKGEWRSRGKDDNFSIVIEKARIARYVELLKKSVIEIISDSRRKAEDLVKSLFTSEIHEIRSMNTGIYHAAYELAEKLKYESSYINALSKNVVALSELVSSRIELADLVANTAHALKPKRTPPIGVWKKFEKIAKCYTAYAKRTGISISITGESHGVTNGISSFEMIPLVVIDNAVKYSPPKKNVEIAISEHNHGINCVVRSLGPKIEPEEREKIFLNKYRGQHARENGESGSGIGLYFLSVLLSEIDGVVEINQGEDVQKFYGKNYYETTFEIRFKKI